MMTFIATWLAFAPAPTTQGEAAPFWVQMMPMVILFVMFYFILIRPQVKRQKEQDALIKGVKTGDKVLAAGGIYGVISNLKDDVITLKIAEGVKIEVQRSSIVSVVKDASNSTAS